MLITDSSVFPTSTGYGPTLTLVALAVRAARALAGVEPLDLGPSERDLSSPKPAVHA